MDDEDLNKLPSFGDSGSGGENSKVTCGDMKMETDNVVSLPVTSGSGCEIENRERGIADCQPCDVVEKENNLGDEKLLQTKGHMQSDSGHCLPETSLGKDLADNQPTMLVNVELTQTVTVPEEIEKIDKSLHAENGFPALNDESSGRSYETDRSSILGVKRARSTVDEHQPQVHVVYNSLSRASRQKLEELLQQWSEWHAQHVSLSNDPSELLESGEETFFPALHVGLERTSAVSFWMDNQSSKEQNMGFIPLDGKSVPLYDRGFALGLTSADGVSSNVEGGLEIIDDVARCFNCGSYTHSLRECPRPRDNVAVNIARKQHKSKRNQNTASRNPTRYYQNPPVGKYDGLRPGALHAETRQLLGLGELDPPPWFKRMRELGYPPGYLDVDDEDQPSGITIFADGEITEQEDGEIIEGDHSKPNTKMTVEYPGINAPIPDNADERLWSAGPSSSEFSRNQPLNRLNHSVDYASRGYYREQRSSRDFRDDRSLRDFRDDGPPGDPGYVSLKYSFHPRYGYDDNHGSTMARSLSDRGRRSPFRDEESSNLGTFHSYHYSHYSPPERLLSPRNLDSDRDWDRFMDKSEGRQRRSWR